MIEVGDIVTLSTLVYDTGGALADGGAVSVVVTLPDGTTSSPTVTHPALGTYTAPYITTLTNEHVVTWTVTGANAGSFVDSFVVESPAFGIVSLAETKAYLRITRTNDDEILRFLILAASDLCESAQGTGRTWRRTVVTAEKHTGNSQSIVFNRRPVQSVTSLTVDGVAQNIPDFDLETWRLFNPNGVFSSSLRRGNVLVSYVAGPTATIPAGVRDGVLEMVRHLYAMHRGGSNLPRQEEPDYTESLGYLVPNRVKDAWLSHSSGF